jgi:hypothetical protein
MTEPRNGHVDWDPWRFDYGVYGKQGLSLVNGLFRGHQVFRKISLPVIRVKYEHDGWFSGYGLFCGPFNDQIQWDPYTFGDVLQDIGSIGLYADHHLVRLSDCGDRYICIREPGPDRQWLELGVYARIGAYHIYQAYYLSRQGAIVPRVWSKGLSCNDDHRHHPYWRFAFALDNPATQRAAVVHDGGVSIYRSEGRDLGSRYANPRWVVENVRSGSRAAILPWSDAIVPAAENGPADGFSNLDVYVRKFRASEDRDWPHDEREDLSFALNETLSDEEDLVLWYVGHLSHQAAAGGDHWHSVGPTVLFTVPDDPRLQSQHFVRWEDRNGLTGYALTGVFVIHQRGRADWYRDLVSIELPIPQLPSGRRFQLVHFDPNVTLSAIGNDGAATWSGWALDWYRLRDPWTPHETVVIECQVAVRDIDGWVYRLSYDVELLGRVI